MVCLPLIVIKPVIKQAAFLRRSYEIEALGSYSYFYFITRVIALETACEKVRILFVVLQSLGLRFAKSAGQLICLVNPRRMLAHLQT